jgi:hypothetical protein
MAAVFGDVQAARELGVGQAFRDQQRHLAFPRR